MNSNIDEHKDLIQLIKAVPEVSAPESFTLKVMDRLQAKAKLSFFNTSWISIQSHWTHLLSVSDGRRCSLCFFITGYFYLIMGIILVVGFQSIGSSITSMEWLELQPYFVIGVAIWLLSLGMILMTGSNTAIRIAKYGTCLYVFFTVINGMLVWYHLHTPYAGASFVGLVGINTLMGFLLALAVQKTELRSA